MKRWLIAASLILVLAPGRAVRAAQPQDPAQTLAKKFNMQEQILLSGVLADPATAQEFARDAAGAATQAVFDKWRQRVALFSRQYLDGPHPTDDSARSVKDMVPPAEWQMLMTSLRMLSEGGLTDQAKFRIFLAMIDNANDDLKADPPDTRNAHKVIALGRSKVSEAMKQYLASPTGQAALAEALRQRSAPALTVTTTAAAPKTAAAAPKPRPKPESKALAQAQELASQTSAASESSEKPGDMTFDGATERQSPEPSTPVDSAGTAAMAISGPSLPVLAMPTVRPTLAVKLAPPSPSAGDKDMAELHQRTKKVSGHKKWFAAAGLGILGAVVGFLVAGPIGAAVMGAAAGVAGHRVGHYLWG